MVTAPDRVWKELIDTSKAQTKPILTRFKSDGFEFYEEMLKIIGSRHATGKFVRGFGVKNERHDEAHFEEELSDIEANSRSVLKAYQSAAPEEKESGRLPPGIPPPATRPRSRMDTKMSQFFNGLGAMMSKPAAPPSRQLASRRLQELFASENWEATDGTPDEMVQFVLLLQDPAIAELVDSIEDDGLLVAMMRRKLAERS